MPTAPGLRQYPPPSSPRRWALVALLAAVLGLHLALLAGLRQMPRQPQEPRPGTRTGARTAISVLSWGRLPPQAAPATAGAGERVGELGGASAGIGGGAGAGAATGGGPNLASAMATAVPAPLQTAKNPPVPEATPPAVKAQAFQAAAALAANLPTSAAAQAGPPPGVSAGAWREAPGWVAPAGPSPQAASAGPEFGAAPGREATSPTEAATTSPIATPFVPPTAPPAAGQPLPPRPEPQPAQHPPPPLYPVDFPPPGELRYQVTRGGHVGEGHLRWELGPGGYSVGWHSRVPGQPDMQWFSRGRVDEAGLAPERLVEARRQRPVAAVNFQRDKGLISFSGPSATAPLHPGAQDRASWLLQLVAVVRGGGLQLAPGGEATLQVASPRGDVAFWTFRYQEHGALTLAQPTPAHLPSTHPPSAPQAPPPLLRTVHLLREPQRPYDLRVRVWLALEHGLLPVRVVQEVVPHGEPVEWWLLDGLPSVAEP